MMDELVIETNDLTKRYGEQVAVDRLSLRVRRGEVYGFLGPNGAGKTTTLRMLVGLVRPTSGAAVVLGAEPGSPRGLARIGALVEGPALYPYLSGRDNLRVLAGHAGVTAQRVEEVLDVVELLDRAGDRTSGYSLGMRQRLGVAAALLKDPDLVILDEPTNGLDPAGMADMRSFVGTLAEHGVTVLLSSHLMAEVQQCCDRVGVIREGVLVAEGTVSDIRGRPRLRLRAEPIEDAARVASGLPSVAGIARDGDAMEVTAPLGEAAAINRALVEAGIEVFELTPRQASLEDVFLELTAAGATR
jgi:ABC-type multidrug transport system ATPase subunit